MAGPHVHDAISIHLQSPTGFTKNANPVLGAGTTVNTTASTFEIIGRADDPRGMQFVFRSNF